VKFWQKTLIAVPALVLVAGIAGVGYALWWLQAPLRISSDQLVVLERGEPFARFAARLHDLGFIDHPRLWTLSARVSGDARRVKAGEYRVRPGDSPQILMARLMAGEVVTYQAQIVEGWTAMQALAMLRADPVLRSTLDGVDADTLLEVLGLPPGHAEGMFFPDTYQFVRGDSDADILRRAYARMQSKLQAAWEERSADLPYDSPYEALIVASLVEKETGRDVERPLIAQVFVLRLQLGMRLQTDPSVIYGIGEAFDGDLRRADLRRPTPYNTYVHRGLPPTPIALPGERSIIAALHPADGEYLFFVSRGDGTSKFSVSLEEHEQAVRRYQLR
jgi:UPF0755 protein